MPLFAGPGVTPTLRGNVNNVIALQPGSVYPFPVAGWYETLPGLYTVIQEYDPISQIWRSVGAGPGTASLQRVYVDGSTNYRLSNLSGCAVGANVTTAGSGYVTAPTVTASAGGSVWRAIVGGAINTTVTVTNGGSNYGYAPVVLFSAPPPGGVQATGYCTLTAGAVSSVTVVDQGAGYNAPPTVTFMNDPREGYNNVTFGGGAAAITTLTGAGTVTAVLCVDSGSAVTTTPTLTFSSGAAAATAIMAFAITAYAVTGGGTTYSGDVIVNAVNKTLLPAPVSLPTSAYRNPSIQQNLVRQRIGSILAALSGGAITATGQKVIDGGLYSVDGTGLSAIIQTNANPLLANAATLTLTTGGVVDTSIILTT